jgi:NADPH-dependent glutamate synthase beta subunit-like oxidoreductase
VADGERHGGIPPIAISNTTTLVNRTGSWKYIRPVYQDRVAPCNSGCPVGIDIEGYMNLLREGRKWEAMDLLLRENPMPAITGRVCDHPCETHCNRRYLDDAVSIHGVERMLGDEILLEHPPIPVETRREDRVAIVGSGPAGLACGYHLARLGHHVVVYEAAPEPGGMLRLGIPEYRLPREVLDVQIERIRAEGVEIRCGVRVGPDVPWGELARYDAVFVASGAHQGRAAGMEGEDSDGVRSGLDFLKEVNAGARPEVGRRVIVVGGGNTAIDCARTARRLGAEVLILYRRTRTEMPAIEDEILEAEREGVEFEFLAAPHAVAMHDGRLRGIECVRMELGAPDDSGRRRPVPTDEGQFSALADTVLTAIGEITELGFLPPEIHQDRWQIVVDELCETDTPVVFAGGDVTDSPRTVAHALGDGKRAALGIDRYLRSVAGETVPDVTPGDYCLGPEGNVSMTRWREDDPLHRTSPVNEVVGFEDMNPNHFQRADRHPDRHLAASESLSGFEEVNRGLTTEEAATEALRCMNCGVCNQCELCLIFCPDMAVSRSEDGWGFVIDMEYCKGCGVCAAECPRGAMVMTREGL